MGNVVTSYSNFAKGKLDHNMGGRFDLPIYQSGADVFENFISNYQGNAIFSAGFMSEVVFQDCAFVEFKFGINQNYLCIFYASNVRFLAYDTNGNLGWVLDGSSNILTVSSPYTLADAKYLSFRNSYAQNNDTMYIVHRSYAPRKLTRVSANSFTLATYTRTNDPFTGAGLWPGAAAFYQGKLYMASTTNKPTTVWNSNSGLYDDFTIQSPIIDASGFNFGIANITQQIEWLFPGDNSLIAGATDGIVAINGGGVNTTITPSTVQATLTSAEPTNGAYPLKKEGQMFYVGFNNRNMYYFQYDILTQLFLSKDANISAYDVTKGNLGKIRFKKDRNDLIFGLRGDGQVISCNFKQAENIIGWHNRTTPGISRDKFQDIAVMGDNLGNPQLFALVNRNGTFYIELQASYVEFAVQNDFYTGNQDVDEEAYTRYLGEQLRDCVFLDGSVTFEDFHTSTITYNPIAGTVTAGSSSFSSGDVGKHIVYKTQTGYESGRFKITAYNSATSVNVDVLQEPVTYDDEGNQEPLDVWSQWYKTFLSVSGLSQFNGTTVGVCTDGGFLAEFDISSGTVTFPEQTATMVLGYMYTGIIKTFCLGFVVQGQNTQTTVKNVNRVGIRCVASAGGKVGTDRYHLEDVQLLSQRDLNYLPPLPVDGTQYVDYTDDAEEDKYLYAVQDQPLPFQIAAIMLQANYAMKP